MCGEQYYRTILAKLWTGAVLYGFYLTLFGASVYVLVRRKPNRFYLAVTIAIFIFTTADTLLEFIQTLLTPLIATTTEVRDNAVFQCVKTSLAQEREELINNLLGPIQTAMYAANTAVADGLLIYRCGILWGYKKWIVTPLVTILVATSVCNMAVVGYFGYLYVFDKGIVSGSRPSDIQAQLAINDAASSFSITAAALSLAVTIVTTTLIATRIWIMARDVQKTMGRMAGSKYRTAIAIIVESGALYAVCLILDTAAGFTEFDGTILSGGIINYVVPIAPTLVMVRVGMGKGFETVQDSVHISNFRNGALERNVSVNGGTGAVSTLHFRTVQEAESETSDVAEESNAAGDGAEPLSVLNGKGRVADDVQDVV